jgi:hypothetical protein
MRIRRFLHQMRAILCLCGILFLTTPAQADFFGGDIPLLIQLVTNTFSQLQQLKQIIGNGNDTLGLMREINRGIQDAIQIRQTMNQSIKSGVLSQYQSPEDVLQAIQNLYGSIPKTSEAKLQQLNDQSVAEAVTLHNQAFQYASEIDPEAERMKSYAQNVSPLGAERLTAQSLAVLIHVSNQILRTNAAMLKVLSESLALQNHKEKASSQQFQIQYDELSSAFKQTHSFKKSLNLAH